MPAAPATIILATGNPHKVSELRAIFAAGGGLQISVLGLSDLPFHAKLREPDEHGATFEENARIKGLSYATQIAALSKPESRFLCLADDSGLEIDALQGRPGVISSHYCTAGVETAPPMSRPERDAANNARVLHELESVPTEKRTARFVCCMCLARPEQPGESWAKAILHETRGTFEGRIGIPPRIPAGSNGFGYDPLFLVAPTFTQTGAELATDEKNRLSHRAQAATLMAEWVRSQLK